MFRALIFVFVIWKITFCYSLSCLQCDIVYNISDCQNAQPCPGVNDICYTDVNVPNTPFQTFSLGCRPRSLCTLASPVTIIGRRREAPLHGCNKCCDKDGCNAKLCQKADDLLMFTDTGNKGVYVMNVNSQQFQKLPVTVSNPIAIDYDPIDGKVYWTDVSLEAIKSSSLDGSDEKTLYKLPSGAVPDGIAVDDVSRLLFYTDTGNDVIGLMKLDGTDKTTIVRSGMKEPRAIVLDKEKGTIYWTDWGLPAIEKASYDGSNRQKLVTTGLKWPNGLAIDTQAQKLYWADGGLYKIESINIDGSGRHVLYTGSSSSHLFGLAVLGDFIFFTDWSQKSVMTIDTLGVRGSSQFGPQRFGRLNGIEAYRSGNDNTGVNGCSINRGGCSRLCIPDQINGTKCLCPDGTHLQSDRKSCA